MDRSPLCAVFPGPDPQTLPAPVDNDDPAAEVATVKAAYAKARTLLRGPNQFEPRGQAFFVVPGIFWYMPRLRDREEVTLPDLSGPPACTTPGGTVCLGADGSVDGPKDFNCSWIENGTHCEASPNWLTGKIAAYSAWAAADPSIVGMNVWVSAAALFVSLSNKTKDSHKPPNSTGRTCLAWTRPPSVAGRSRWDPS